MVAEQRETVQRIDADTLDIASNVSGAQRELLKYWGSVSSNRWLMVKLFGVLIVFVSLFSKKFGPRATGTEPFLVPGIYTGVKLRTQWPGATGYLSHTEHFYFSVACAQSVIIHGHFQTNYPTGIALTPVPHCFPRGRAFACFLPPRCVWSSSPSSTVHVRRFDCTCSNPDVAENRCGMSGTEDKDGSFFASFSMRSF
jgi:hypothetical protein